MFQSLNFHTPIMPWRLPAIPKPCSGAGQLHSISPDFWGSKPEPSCWQLDQHCTEDCNNHPAPISCTPDTADICGLWDLFCLPSPKPLQNCFHPASSQSAPELILPQRCKEAAKCQSPHGTIMTLQLYRHIFSSVIRYRWFSFLWSADMSQCISSISMFHVTLELASFTVTQVHFLLFFTALRYFPLASAISFTSSFEAFTRNNLELDLSLTNYVILRFLHPTVLAVLVYHLHSLRTSKCKIKPKWNMKYFNIFKHTCILCGT